MRDYGIVSPKFWTGSTGRALRGNSDAQVVALYLMTSPHSSMIGLYHCPLVYISNDTGIPIEGASKALARLCEAGFCEIDPESDTVFVVNMAAHQLGDTLNPSDKRVEGVRRHLRQIGENPLVARFIEVYGHRYGVTPESIGAKPLLGPYEAPPKPRTRTGTRTGIKNKDSASAEFDKFWNAYPRGDGKKAALKAWINAGLDAQADRIIVDVMSRKWPEAKFIPHASTYLNQERWLDRRDDKSEPTWRDVAV